LYAWAVTDNGTATGIQRPADERRIQAIGNENQLIEATSDPDTVVLGWSEDFTSEPLIVAFNPYGVAGRVNGKIDRKLAAGAEKARVSDSQQFRQVLLDTAVAKGIALGQNQHGEFVIAMKPAAFLDYLNQFKPKYHSATASKLPQGVGNRGMEELVSEAERDIAEPADAEDDSAPTFDPTDIADGRERVAREIAIRRGQAAFRASLLKNYGCCAMTGSTVESVLEAAHIVPYRGPGSNHISNGLLLRGDLHTLFDLGMLAVDPNSLKILVSQRLSGTEYEVLRGQSLRVAHAAKGPSNEAIAVHLASAVP